MFYIPQYSTLKQKCANSKMYLYHISQYTTLEQRCVYLCSKVVYSKKWDRCIVEFASLVMAQRHILWTVYILRIQNYCFCHLFLEFEISFCLTWYLNSLGPSDAIWRHRSGSTLTHVLACCLTAPSHYLTNVDLSLVRSSGIHLRAIL